MAKKKASVSGRAWRLLQLALLWARKGGAFKRSLMLDLRTLFRSIRADGMGRHNDRVHYLEREFSFDETPMFNFKMHRPASKRLPRLPCITPSVDFDNDHDDWMYEKKREFFRSEKEDEEEEFDCEVCEEAEEVVEEEGIDSKAEEFIAKFYEEMKFERQVSVLQYNEMLRRGMN